MAILRFHRPCYNVRFCPHKANSLAVISCDHVDLGFRGSLHILRRSSYRWIEKKRFDFYSSLSDIQWCDAKYIATSSGDGSLQIWNSMSPNHEPNNQPTLLEGHTDEVNSIDVCRRTYRVISASSDFSVILWDLKEKKIITQYQIPEAVCFQAQFRPYTHDMFASVSSDRSLIMWDIRSPTPQPVACVPKAHQVNCYSCSWCPESDYKIATSGADTYIKVWDLRNLSTPMFKLGPIQTPTKKVSFAPSSNNLVGAVSYDGITRVWDLTNLPHVVEMKNHIGFASGLDWNPMNCNLNNKEISDCGWDGVVHVYDFA